MAKGFLSERTLVLHKPISIAPWHFHTNPHFWRKFLSRSVYRALLAPHTTWWGLWNHFTFVTLHSQVLVKLWLFRWILVAVRVNYWTAVVCEVVSQKPLWLLIPHRDLISTQGFFSCWFYIPVEESYTWKNYGHLYSVGVWHWVAWSNSRTARYFFALLMSNWINQMQLGV